MAQRRPIWPDYMSKATLAQRLDLAEGAIDQYVTRGLLPAPVAIGDALRWRWADVEACLVGGTRDAGSHDYDGDPYFAGVRNGSSRADRTSAARS